MKKYQNLTYKFYTYNFSSKSCLTVHYREHFYANYRYNLESKNLDAFIEEKLNSYSGAEV